MTESGNWRGIIGRASGATEGEGGEAGYSVIKCYDVVWEGVLAWFDGK